MAASARSRARGRDRTSGDSHDGRDGGGRDRLPAPDGAARRSLHLGFDDVPPVPGCVLAAGGKRNALPRRVRPSARVAPERGDPAGMDDGHRRIRPVRRARPVPRARRPRVLRVPRVAPARLRHGAGAVRCCAVRRAADADPAGGLDAERPRRRAVRAGDCGLRRAGVARPPCRRPGHRDACRGPGRGHEGHGARTRPVAGAHPRRRGVALTNAAPVRRGRDRRRGAGHRRPRLVGVRAQRPRHGGSARPVAGPDGAQVRCRRERGSRGLGPRRLTRRRDTWVTSLAEHVAHATVGELGIPDQFSFAIDSAVSEDTSA